MGSPFGKSLVVGALAVGVLGIAPGCLGTGGLEGGTDQTSDGSAPDAYHADAAIADGHVASDATTNGDANGSDGSMIIVMPEDAGDAGMMAIDSALPDGGCADTETDCTDGIDNNCDGLTDCADPACSPYVKCVPPPPDATWSIATFDSTGRDACPAGFSASTDVDVNPTGSGSCSCSCTNTCSPDITFTTYQSPDLHCLTSPSATYTATTPNVCLLPSPALSGGFNTLAVIAAGNPCGASVAALPAPTYGSGRLCDRTATAAGGCTDGDVCVAKTSDAAFSQCIVASGTPSCPATNYTKKFTTGTSVSDQRACSSCTCSASGGACETSLTVTDSLTCFVGVTGPEEPADRDTIVEPVCGSTTVSSIKGLIYTTPTLTGGTCGITTNTTLSGAVSINSEQTVCCQ
jgi:hypothetical protein